MIIVVLSPHRDDAAFSLGLAIDAWLAAGHTVSVLNCFTQSAYAPFSDVEQVHANDRTSFVSALRKREDVAWNKLTGNKLSFQDLDMLDAPLRLACGLDEVLTVDIRAGDRAVARIAGAVSKIISKAQSHRLAFAVPLAIGGHIDHRVVRQAATDALQATLVPAAFYEDLPYAARGDEGSRIPAVAASIDLELKPYLAGQQLAEVSSAIKRKLRLSECYDSQVGSEEVRAIAEFSGRYDGSERLWANVAWRASELTVEGEGQESRG